MPRGRSGGQELTLRAQRIWGKRDPEGLFSPRDGSWWRKTQETLASALWARNLDSAYSVCESPFYITEMALIRVKGQLEGFLVERSITQSWFCPGFCLWKTSLGCFLGSFPDSSKQFISRKMSENHMIQWTSELAGPFLSYSSSSPLSTPFPSKQLMCF